MDVADVVRAMIRLMESEITGQRFILSAEHTTYRELFSSIAHSFGKKPPHRKVTPLIAALVWRMEAIKAKFTGRNPLLTKETAHTAQAKVYFDNSKLLEYLPGFQYKPLQQSIAAICKELQKNYPLH